MNKTPPAHKTGIKDNNFISFEINISGGISDTINNIKHEKDNTDVKGFFDVFPDWINTGGCIIGGGGCGAAGCGGNLSGGCGSGGIIEEIDIIM